MKTVLTTSHSAPGVTSATAAVNGVRLHYLVGGEPDGPPVLLWHGFLNTCQSWRKVVPILTQAGYAVLAPDMRGYGDSDKPGGCGRLRCPGFSRGVSRPGAPDRLWRRQTSAHRRPRHGRAARVALGGRPPGGSRRTALPGDAGDALDGAAKDHRLHFRSRERRLYVVVASAAGTRSAGKACRWQRARPAQPTSTSGSRRGQVSSAPPRWTRPCGPLPDARGC